MHFHKSILGKKMFFLGPTPCILPIQQEITKELELFLARIREILVSGKAGLWK
jgi:hypothetical protein